MNVHKLDHEQLAALCRALEHLCHAGISTGDALALLAEDETAAQEKELLQSMSRWADEGRSLAEIFRESECFPAYACQLMAVGERVGKSEDTLRALADHYRRRARLEQQLKSSLLYPSVLLAVLLAVLLVLLVWVLPVFDEVYARLGSRLSGLAGGLLALGGLLRKLMPLLGLALLAAAVFWLVMKLSPDARERCAAAWRRRSGDKGIARRVNTARFAQALSLGMTSGMNSREAVDLAGELAQGSEGFQRRCRACREKLEQGAGLSAALRESELLSKGQCRLLEAGLRSGRGEQVMEQIAQQALEDSEQELERIAERIEPTVVVILSVLVGAILLSVMLPLMHIMAAIG